VKIASVPQITGTRNGMIVCYSIESTVYCRFR